MQGSFVISTLHGYLLLLEYGLWIRIEITYGIFDIKQSLWHGIERFNQFTRATLHATDLCYAWTRDNCMLLSNTESNSDATIVIAPDDFIGPRYCLLCLECSFLIKYSKAISDDAKPLTVPRSEMRIGILSSTRIACTSLTCIIDTRTQKKCLPIRRVVSDRYLTCSLSTTYI